MLNTDRLKYAMVQLPCAISQSIVSRSNFNLQSTIDLAPRQLHE
jgi:hypothetical protein